MRRIGAALAALAIAALLASAEAYLVYFNDRLDLVRAILWLLVVVICPVALGGVLALLLTWNRRWHLIDLLVGLPGGAGAALLSTFPLLWEEWDYFRRTPPPAFGWELVPLGVLGLGFISLVLGIVGYLVGLAVGTRSERGRALRADADALPHPGTGRGRRDRWMGSATVTGLSSLVIVLDIVLLPHVFGLLAPPPLPPEPPVACASVAPIDETRAFHGDPRSVAPLPGDLGPDWDPYKDDLEEIGFGAYSATYRLGNPQTSGLLLSFKVRIFGDVAGAADEYCHREEHPRDSTDFPIGDGLFIRPVSGGAAAVGRARNVIIEMGTWNPGGDRSRQSPYIEAAMRAFAQRVNERTE